jgi:hypothetical protein
LTTTLQLGDYQTRPFFDQEFLNTFTSIPGGWALDTLVGLLGDSLRGQSADAPDPWAAIAKATKEVAETDLKVDLAFFPKPNKGRGSIANIREDNFTVGHLFRAAFNDMAEKYCAWALRLWPDKLWKNIVFSGGVACQFDVLRDVIQKRFRTASRLAPFREDTLFGLLILALGFSGEIDSVRETIKEVRSTCPGEEQEARDLAS